jgi:hypothetical protein
MSYIYPESNSGVQGPLYYVEFDRGNQSNTFTLFKRQFIIPPNEWDTSLMSNEGHPWNIMTDKYGPDGCMPDKHWVMWMVDALNEKCERCNNPK